MRWEWSAISMGVLGWHWRCLNILLCSVENVYCVSFAIESSFPSTTLKIKYHRRAQTNVSSISRIAKPRKKKRVEKWSWSRESTGEEVMTLIISHFLSKLGLFMTSFEEREFSSHAEQFNLIKIISLLFHRMHVNNQRDWDSRNTKNENKKRSKRIKS